MRKDGFCLLINLSTGVTSHALNLVDEDQNRYDGSTYAKQYGRYLEGNRLPFFDEAKELVLKAHSLLCPNAMAIGWDVIITDEGPFLLEANIFTGRMDEEALDQYALCCREMIKRLQTIHQSV